MPVIARFADTSVEYGPQERVDRFEGKFNIQPHPSGFLYSDQNYYNGCGYGHNRQPPQSAPIPNSVDWDDVWMMYNQRKIPIVGQPGNFINGYRHHTTPGSGAGSLDDRGIVWTPVPTTYASGWTLTGGNTTIRCGRHSVQTNFTYTGISITPDYTYDSTTAGKFSTKQNFTVYYGLHRTNDSSPAYMTSIINVGQRTRYHGHKGPPRQLASPGREFHYGYRGIGMSLEYAKFAITAYGIHRYAYAVNGKIISGGFLDAPVKGGKSRLQFTVNRGPGALNGKNENSMQIWGYDQNNKFMIRKCFVF